MSLSFTQTDTTTHCRTTLDGQSECVSGGTAGTTEQTVTITAEATNEQDAVFEVDITDETTPNGSYTVRLNVTTADMFIFWTQTTVEVRNGSCTLQGSAHTEDHTNVGLTTTGVVSVTFTASGLPALTSGDRLCIVLHFDNNQMTDRTVGFTPDQDIDTPLEGLTSKTVATTASATATLTPLSNFFRNLSATASSVGRLTLLIAKTLTSTAAISSTISTLSTFFRDLSATGSSTATLDDTFISGSSSTSDIFLLPHKSVAINAVKPLQTNIGPHNADPKWGWFWRNFNVYTLPFTEGAGSPRDVVAGDSATLTGADHEWVTDLHGRSLRLNQAAPTSDTYCALRNALLDGAGQMTILLYVRWHGLGGDNTNEHALYSEWEGGNRTVLFRWDPSISRWEGFIFTTAQIGSSFSSLSAAITDNKFHPVALRWNGTSLDLFEDGIKDVTSFSGSGALGEGSGSIVKLGSDATADGSEFDFSFAAVFRTALSDDQIKQWSNDPFGPIRTGKRYIPFEFGAAEAAALNEETLAALSANIALLRTPFFYFNLRNTTADTANLTRPFHHFHLRQPSSVTAKINKTLFETLSGTVSAVANLLRPFYLFNLRDTTADTANLTRPFYHFHLRQTSNVTARITRNITRTLAAVANATANLLRPFYHFHLRIVSSVVATITETELGGAVTEFTLSAVASVTATLSRLALLVRSFSVVGSATATLSRLALLARSFSAVVSATATISILTTFLRTLAATVSATATMTLRLVLSQTLAAIASVTANILRPFHYFHFRETVASVIDLTVTQPFAQITHAVTASVTATMDATETIFERLKAFIGYGGGIGIGEFKGAERWNRRIRKWGRR